MRGRAAQIFGSFGFRKEGSSSGSPRVAFRPGTRTRREARRARRRATPPVLEPFAPSLSAVQRELRAERQRTHPG